MDEQEMAKLLVCLAKFVMCTTLKRFSVDLLGISSQRFNQIETKYTEPNVIILQLLLEWLHKGSWTQIDLLALVAEGIAKEYVHPEALKAICKKTKIDQNDRQIRNILGKLNTSRKEQIILSSLSAKHYGVQDIQKWTRQTYRTPPFNLAVNSKSSFMKSVKLNDVKTNFKWSQVHRDVTDDVKNDVEGPWEVFTDHELDKGPFRLLITGEPGAGKTFFTKVLATEWANKSRRELSHFDVVFTVPCGLIKPRQSLEETIKMCHLGLTTNNVQLEYINDLLYKQESNYRVLLVIDGYEEYDPDLNPEINEALFKCLQNTSIVVTSRPTDKLNTLRPYLDFELEIQGFSEENILQYASKYFSDVDKATKLVAQAKEQGIFNVLKTPAILQYVCEIFASDKEIPNTKEKIIHEIFWLSLEWASKQDEVCWSEAAMDQMIYELGKLSWCALQNKGQTVFHKEEILDLVPESVLQSRLFTSENCSDRSCVSFHHRLLQEYAASHFLQADISKNRQPNESFLSTLRGILDHRAVLQFMCGMSEDAARITMDICQGAVAQFIYLHSDIAFVRTEDVEYFHDLKTVFELLRVLHAECVKYVQVEALVGKDLWVLSSDDCPVPKHPPEGQKLVLVHKLIASIAAEYYSTSQKRSTNGSGTKCLMIIQPDPNCFEVLSCISQLVSKMDTIETVCLCHWNPEQTSGEALHKLTQIGNDLFGRHKLREVKILKSSLLQPFWDEMMEGLRNGPIVNFDLRFCDIPHSIPSIADSLQTFSNLKSLRLRGCISTAIGAETICQQVLYLTSLEILDLSENKCIGQFVGILAEVFTNWRDHPLKQICLGECYIPAEHNKVILKSLANLPNLRIVSLQRNELGGSLSELVLKLPLVEELDLCEVGMQSGDILCLSAAVQSHRLSNLKRLNLARNDLHDNQINTLLTQLNTTHTEDLFLDFRNNNITEENKQMWSTKSQSTLIFSW